MSRRFLLVILSVFAIMLAAAGCGIGPSIPGVNQDLMKAEANALLDKYQSAYKREDAEGFAACFTDPHTEVLATGTYSYSLNETKQGAAVQFALLTVYDCQLQNRNISIINSASALVTTDLYVDQEIAGIPSTRGQVTERTEFTLEKQGGSWKINKARPLNP